MVAYSQNQIADFITKSNDTNSNVRIGAFADIILADDFTPFRPTIAQHANPFNETIPHVREAATACMFADYNHCQKNTIFGHTPIVPLQTIYQGVFAGAFTQDLETSRNTQTNLLGCIDHVITAQQNGSSIDPFYVDIVHDAWRNNANTPSRDVETARQAMVLVFKNIENTKSCAQHIATIKDMTDPKHASFEASVYLSNKITDSIKTLGIDSPSAKDLGEALSLFSIDGQQPLRLREQSFQSQSYIIDHFQKKYLQGTLPPQHEHTAISMFRPNVARALGQVAGIPADTAGDISLAAIHIIGDNPGVMQDEDLEILSKAANPIPQPQVQSMNGGVQERSIRSYAAVTIAGLPKQGNHLAYKPLACQTLIRSTDPDQEKDVPIRTNTWPGIAAHLLFDPTKAVKTYENSIARALDPAIESNIYIAQMLTGKQSRPEGNILHVGHVTKLSQELANSSVVVNALQKAAQSYPDQDVQNNCKAFLQQQNIPLLNSGVPAVAPSTATAATPSQDQSNPPPQDDPPSRTHAKGIRLNFNGPNGLDPYAANHVENVEAMFNRNAGNPIPAKVDFSMYFRGLPEGTNILVNIRPDQLENVKKLASVRNPEFEVVEQADGTFNATLTEAPPGLY